VPPFGHATQLRIFIDPDLLQYDGVNDMVWAAAGTWNDVFPIDPRVLQRVTSGVVVEMRRGT
jgi:prolyl-tRNA editing enzyme YbaK/EbsC (Cys-tRNA(Pro) deacylase)